MTGLALAVAAILTLASSGAIAQEGQPPGAAPPTAQQPAAPPPAAEQPATPPPIAQQPEAPPAAAQRPTAQQPGGGLRGPRRWYFACRPEAAQFCGQVRPGGGRIRLCLLHRYYKLPQGCRQALVQGRQQ
jgi:hypothetical protein